MMVMDWRSAFFLQARSDFRILRHLIAWGGAKPCHRLHYLQMATEKLAKGFSTDGTIPPATVHSAFVRFLQRAHTNKSLRRACQMEDKKRFQAYLEALLPLGKRIEDLAPSGVTQRPNAEYPWLARARNRAYPTEAADSIVVPAQCRFAGLDMGAPTMIRMMRFLQTCFDMISS
ncbi:MAG: hypothetical protein NTW86_21185 [Candidatus Sumerlaeota bacterium]|nr:hypothetical protein [Candidatus Sumerlaeota bacterium]